MSSKMEWSLVKERKAQFDNGSTRIQHTTRERINSSSSPVDVGQRFNFAQMNGHDKSLGSIGKGALLVTITYYPQVCLLSDKKKEDTDGKSEPVECFSDEDFKAVLKKIKSKVFCDVCLTANKGEGFCMYSCDCTQDSKPAVTVTIKGQSGDVTPSDPLISTVMKILDEHWGNACRSMSQ